MASVDGLRNPKVRRVGTTEHRHGWHHGNHRASLILYSIGLHRHGQEALAQIETDVLEGDVLGASRERIEAYDFRINHRRR